MTGYEIIVHPYKNDSGEGLWDIRCYTYDGDFVHAAESGVSLRVGLEDCRRAIEQQEEGESPA